MAALKSFLAWAVLLLAPFLCHARNPQSVAFSPNGRIVAMGVGGSPESHYLKWESFGHIDLWSMETGKPIRRIPHYGDITRLAFSPNGKHLAAVGLYTPGDSVNGDRVWISNPSTGEITKIFRGAHNFAFSPNGKTIAVTDAFSTTFYEVGSWKKQRELRGLSRDVSSLAFSPNGKLLAAAVDGRNGTEVQIYDATTGKKLRSTGELSFFYRVIFSPDGQSLVTGEKGRLRLWKTSNLEQVRTFSVNENTLLHPFFSPNGSLLGGLGQSQPVLALWDVKTGRRARSFTFKNARLDTVYARFGGIRHRPEDGPYRAAFSPNGKTIALGYDHGILIDATTGKVRYHLPSDAIKRPMKPEKNYYAEYLQQAGVKTDPNGIRTFLQSYIPKEAARKRGETLIQQLGSSSFKEREAATKELLRDVVTHVELLQKAAKSTDKEMASRARAIIKRYDKMVSDLLLYALEHIARIEMPLTQSLLAVLPELPDDPSIRHAAKHALLCCARPKETGLLQKALRSKDPSVRAIATAAMAQLAEQGAPASLQPLLKDPHPEARLEAAIGASNANSHSGLPVLIELLTNPDPGIRSRSIRALRSLTGHHTDYWPMASKAIRKKGHQQWQQWLSRRGKKVPLTIPYREHWNRMLIWMVDGGVREIDHRGNQTAFFRDNKSITDVRALPNGHRLVAYYSARNCYAIEYDRQGKVIWHSGKVPSFISAAQRLPNGNTLFGILNVHFYHELNREKKVVWQRKTDFRGEPFDITILGNGNFLVAEGRSNRVVEIDRQGKVLWSAEDQGDVVSAQRLPNGRTLVGLRSPGAVRELDPQGRTVWQVKGYRDLCAAQRLPNGFTLIATDSMGVVVIDRNNRVVRKIENLTNDRAQGAWAY